MAKKSKKPQNSALQESARKRTLDELRARGVDLDMVMSDVFNNLKLSVKEIVEKINDKYREYGVQLNREQPYEMLRRAAAEGRFLYIAPLDSDLSLKLLEGHEWLRRARVVRTASADDVARHAALLLLQFTEKWEKDDLHIGVAGGDLMADTIHFFAAFLQQIATMRLKKLYVHALVAAADDPRKSPNGFVRWLLDGPLPFKTEFVGLPTPGFLTASAIESLRAMEGVQVVFQKAGELDLVITSAGAHWGKGCSGLNHKYKESSPESVQPLQDAGCVGDIMWQPFGHDGPIEYAAGKRAVTLLDLNVLPQLVAKGTRVMLVLAPCGGVDCGEPKNEILSAALRWRNGFTDVVVDGRTAALCLRG